MEYISELDEEIHQRVKVVIAQECIKLCRKQKNCEVCKEYDITPCKQFRETYGESMWNYK